MKPRRDQPLRAYWTYVPSLADGGFSRTSFRYWHPKWDRIEADNAAWDVGQRLGRDLPQYARCWIVNYRLPSRRGDPVEVLEAYQLDHHGHRRWGRCGGASGWDARLRRDQWKASRARADASLMRS